MGKLIVAIDGPSGVGKSTTSKLVAKELAIPHIDTGAMYRAIALRAVESGVDLTNRDVLQELARQARIDFEESAEGQRVLLDGVDISSKIRTAEVSMAASKVSAVSEVRRVLVKLQQEIGERHGGVLEGRDIGTKVFPSTPHKFFLTADPEVRAQRRHEELREKGSGETIAEVSQSISQRDGQDSTRADSPLTHDDSYTVVDSSRLSINDVVRIIVGKVRGAQ